MYKKMNEKPLKKVRFVDNKPKGNQKQGIPLSEDVDDYIFKCEHLANGLNHSCR